MSPSDIHSKVLGVLGCLFHEKTDPLQQSVVSAGFEAFLPLQEFRTTFCVTEGEKDEYQKYLREEILERIGNPEFSGAPLDGGALRGYRSEFLERLRQRRGDFYEIRSLGDSSALELISPRRREVKLMKIDNANYQQRRMPYFRRMCEIRLSRTTDAATAVDANSMMTSILHILESWRCGGGSKEVQIVDNRLELTFGRVSGYLLLIIIDLAKLSAPSIPFDSHTRGPSGTLSMRCFLRKKGARQQQKKLSTDLIEIPYKELIPEFSLAYRDFWFIGDLSDSIRANLALLSAADFFEGAHEDWRRILP